MKIEQIAVFPHRSQILEQGRSMDGKIVTRGKEKTFEEYQKEIKALRAKLPNTVFGRHWENDKAGDEIVTALNELADTVTKMNHQDSLYSHAQSLLNAAFNMVDEELCQTHHTTFREGLIFRHTHGLKVRSQMAKTIRAADSILKYDPCSDPQLGRWTRFWNELGLKNHFLDDIETLDNEIQGPALFRVENNGNRRLLGFACLAGALLLIKMAIIAVIAFGLLPLTISALGIGLLAKGMELLRTPPIKSESDSKEFSRSAKALTKDMLSLFAEKRKQAQQAHGEASANADQPVQPMACHI